MIMIDCIDQTVENFEDYISHRINNGVREQYPKKKKKKISPEQITVNKPIYGLENEIDANG